MFFQSARCIQLKEEGLRELALWVIKIMREEAEKAIEHIKDIWQLLAEKRQFHPANYYRSQYVELINQIINYANKYHRNLWMKMNRKYYAKLLYNYVRIKNSPFAAHQEYRYALCFHFIKSHIILNQGCFLSIANKVQSYIQHFPRSSFEQVILAARLIAQGQRSSFSFFQNLPNEIAILIAAHTVFRKELALDQALLLARHHLNRPQGSYRG